MNTFDWILCIVVVVGLLLYGLCYVIAKGMSDTE